MFLEKHLTALVIKEGKVYDKLRSKWLMIAPEELVRQAVINYLIEDKNISKSKLISEYNVEWNGRHHRCDLVLLDANMQPLVIVEVKAPSEPINTTVHQQCSRYHKATGVSKFWITNGATHQYWHKNNNEWKVVLTWDDLLTVG